MVVVLPAALLAMICRLAYVAAMVVEPLNTPVAGLKVNHAGRLFAESVGVGDPLTVNVKP
jgi:hypothetical protein